MVFFKRFLIVFFLCVTLIYVTNITSMPDNIVLFDGEDLSISTVWGVTLKQSNSKTLSDTIVVSSLNNSSHDTITVSLLDIFDLKKIEVNTIPVTSVVPLGNTIGLKLYTSGVLVVGMSEVDGQKPYENSSIQEGDMIVSVNESSVASTNDLIQSIKNSANNILDIKYIRDGNTYNTNIERVKVTSSDYKLGLWVKDGAVGIGTMTYYEPETNRFAALGHGIVDSDTKDLISISNGDIVTSSVTSITKGESNNPGEIRGNILNSQVLGSINSNTNFGIYGTLSNTTWLNIDSSKQYDVALKDEIIEGPAKVLLTLEDNIRKEYDIEIVKIYRNNNYDNKSMLVKITDERLLELTGGIIQGMSGAPIIQNNKFIGAITHVLVNDPTSGYAVFSELMIKESRKS